MAQQFIFPGEPAYESRISSMVKIPMSIDGVLTDENGKVINFDSLINHE